MTDWVRLWHDMPTDPKWRVVARKSKQPLPCVLAVFTLMLTNASNNAGERGTLLGWDHEDAGAALDMDAADVEAIFDAMQGKVLDGQRLTGWERRQPKREDGTAAERKAAWKARKATEENAPERSGTQENAAVRAREETETDTDTTDKSVVGAKRAKRLPGDFEVPEDWRAWAKSDRGWSDSDTFEEAEKFVDYWRAKGGKDAAKADWPATWRNWCRNAHRTAARSMRETAGPLC